MRRRASSVAVVVVCLLGPLLAPLVVTGPSSASSDRSSSPRADATVTAPRHLTITPTKSDHHMLSGWAYVDATAR